MRDFGSDEFSSLYKNYDEKQLKDFLDLVYDALSIRFKGDTNIGQEGSKELLSAILLYMYDKNVQEKIGLGFCKLFDDKMDALEFSIYMNYVVKLSKITEEEWIALYNYIDNNHKWINTYKCI